MSVTKHQYNLRKKALALLIRKMEKEGWTYKKAVKNSVRFVMINAESGKVTDKARVTLEY